MRTALVGGGAGGIGRAIATRLVQSGHRVVLAGRTEGSLQEAAVEIGRSTRRDGDAEGLVDWVVGDIADQNFAEHAVRHVVEGHGALDILVSNAGGPEPGGVLALDDDAWRAAYELLVLGPLRLVRATLPSMADRNFGRVVAVTSTAVRSPQPGLAASTVLRAATTSMAKLLADEYASHGVTVNCVAPGATDTGRRREVLQARAAAAGIDYAEADRNDSAAIPTGRAAEVAEVAAVVDFLCSDDASYVNGTVLTVDGGQTRVP